jgi:hypothetical protein
MGLAGLAGRARAGWVEPRARPNPVDRFWFFFEIFFSARINPGNAQKMFRGTKNTQKITKNPGKFLEVDYDMNNPNKAFGAHEKYFRGF